MQLLPLPVLPATAGVTEARFDGTTVTVSMSLEVASRLLPRVVAAVISPRVERVYNCAGKQWTVSRETGAHTPTTF